MSNQAHYGNLNLIIIFFCYRNDIVFIINKRITLRNAAQEISIQTFTKKARIGLSTAMHTVLHRCHPLLPPPLISSPITTVHSKSFPIRPTVTTSTVRIHHSKTPPFTRRKAVVCMANPRRVKMVAKQIQRELSDMLLTDKVLQYAVLPEAALGADRYLSSLTTISDVVLSSDLQVVKVYVSVFGDDRGKEVALAGLKSKAKYVRSELGRRMKLRLTPEIRFIEDESFERGSRVIALLDKIKADKRQVENEKDDGYESSGSQQDEGDWEGDDPDEGIIYVK